LSLFCFAELSLIALLDDSTTQNMSTIITENDSAQVKNRGSTTTTEIELDKEKPAHKSPDLLDQENAIASSPDSDEPAPDGGARAWTVAAGGAAILFCCLGFANSFGVFEQYYLTHQLQGHSPDKIAWVGSISAYLQFGAGMVGGPMFDRYGAVVSLSIEAIDSCVVY
jgi:hypothetical protein